MPVPIDSDALLVMVEQGVPTGLSESEIGFLLEAIAHFCATRCPLGESDTVCPALTWRESVHSGAIERFCGMTPEYWPARLARLAAPR